jgi:peptidoglycan/xylan/chitin deacetylase (PgdA/CDA1 family)
VYHSIDHIDPADDPYKMNVDPSLFKRQMEHLAALKNGYTVTFDDGFGSVYANAFPIVKRYGMKAVLFLTTDYIDGKIALCAFFAGRASPRPLTWDEVKRMNADGVEIGSHTLTHRNMAALDADTARREASESRKRIMDMTGCETSTFSYPFGNRGSFNALTKAILAECGYARAYTNMMGMDDPAADPFTVKRIRVYSTDNMFRFRMKVNGAYNWVDYLPSRRSLAANIASSGAGAQKRRLPT